MLVLTVNAEKVHRTDQEIAGGASLMDEEFWFDDGKFHLNENFAFNEEPLDFLYNEYKIVLSVTRVI